MVEYGQPEYWDERYRRDTEPFEWYQKWEALKAVIADCVAPTSRILNVGCGNSRMSEDMCNDGYTDITNIDLSACVIGAMKDKYTKTHPTLKWATRDIMDMSCYTNGAYEAVIDKGTLDSILCGENSSTNASQAMKEISRVLTDDGVYICITYGKPTQRLPYIQKEEFLWDVQVRTVTKPVIDEAFGRSKALSDDDPNVHYIYICRKNKTATQNTE